VQLCLSLCTYICTRSSIHMYTLQLKRHDVSAFVTTRCYMVW
jgi:hypothetical protein